MAIYSTLFICKSTELLSAFPGWKLPLTEPVRREVKHPFTGKVMIIESRCPIWQDDDDAIAVAPEVVTVEGRYEDYLESRIPRPVREIPHACLKNLTEVELNPLAEAVDLETAVENALYSPPRVGSILQQLCPELVSKLISLNESGLALIAERWAAIMSGPEYTTSVTGVSLNAGWGARDAEEILQIVVRLSRQAEPDQAIYILIES